MTKQSNWILILGIIVAIILLSAGIYFQSNHNTLAANETEFYFKSIPIQVVIDATAKPLANISEWIISIYN